MVFLWRFGISVGFFEEVMGLDFHDQGKFVKRINASFLVFIPKKGKLMILRILLISLMGSYTSC